MANVKESNQVETIDRDIVYFLSELRVYTNLITLYDEVLHWPLVSTVCLNRATTMLRVNGH